MDLEFLFAPFEQMDATLGALLERAPVAGALALAAALGLRHASDPDHLVAVTSLVSARGCDVRAGVRLAAWWGLGHAVTLLAIGVPLIALHSSIPIAIQAVAERAIGIVIVVLGLRVIVRWLRGGFRVQTHAHPPAQRHRHVEQGPHDHAAARGPAEALAIGSLHGLAGTGAVIVLMIATLESTLTALAALAVFAPMSVVSMAMCTGAYCWLLTRRVVEPVYRRALMPALGVFAVVFGGWYAGG